MTARRKTVFLLVTIFLLLASLFLGDQDAAAASPPTAVEVGIWMHGGPDITPIKNLEAEIGIKFKAAKWYENWDDPWRPWIPNSYHQNGYQPEMSWQPMYKLPDGSFRGVSYDEVVAGNYDAYLDGMAASVKALPFRVRISLANEFNGPWNPWGIGKVGNTPANHRTFWQHVVNRFKSKGVTNVDWVWTPNIDPAKTLPRYSEFYPGADYVTYFGLDGYNFGTTGGGSWQTFRNLYQSSYNELQALASKDIYIIEMGSVEQGGSKAEWIKDMFNDLPAYFPRIKGLIWWNVAYPEYDMRIQTSAAAKAQFALSVNGQADPTPNNPAANTDQTNPNDAPATQDETSGKATATKNGVRQQTAQSEPPAPTTGFILTRLLNAKSEENAPLVAGILLATISLLTALVYLFTRRVLRRAAKYAPA